MKIIYTDQAAVNALIQKVTIAAETIQKAVNEFNSLKLFEIKSTAELDALLRRNESYIRTRLAEGMETQEIRILGVKVRASAKKMLELVDLPDFSRLRERCQECEPFLRFMVYLNFDGKRITIGQNAPQNIKEECSVIARTPAAVFLAEHHEKAAKVLKQLQESFKAAGIAEIDADTMFRRLFSFNATGEIQVNYYFYENNRHAFSE
jgi:hypothetical protein